jgi:imidazole glycerol-phosphate synthase subunit HisF
MLAKRIIPCLDVRDGKTVKGINFENIRDVGDPVELGALYSTQGADELVYLDITATHEDRKLFVELVRRIAFTLNIPFTVGGGISELKDAENLLSAGADKIAVNSAAIRNPDLIDQVAKAFGSQFIVVAIDAHLENSTWSVYLNGGRIKSEKELFSWAKEAENRGCGEILFTSMNQDGTKNGFACESISKLSGLLSVPIIASGGAGRCEHFRDVFITGKADAALAASIFHFKEITIPALKNYLHEANIPVRL